MWEIDSFELPSGRCPINDFLKTLNKKTDIPYILRALDNLAELGYELRRPHAAELEDGIYELRVKTIGGQFRFFYFFFDRNQIILTHGIKKKQGPVGNHQIKLAKDYRNIYLGRGKK